MFHFRYTLEVGEQLKTPQKKSKIKLEGKKQKPNVC